MAASPPTPRQRPPKPLYRIINLTLKAVLRSPRHSPISRRLAVLTFQAARAASGTARPSATPRPTAPCSWPRSRPGGRTCPAARPSACGGAGRTGPGQPRLSLTQLRCRPPTAQCWPMARNWLRLSWVGWTPTASRIRRMSPAPMSAATSSGSSSSLNNRRQPPERF